MIRYQIMLSLTKILFHCPEQLSYQVSLTLKKSTEFEPISTIKSRSETLYDRYITYKSSKMLETTKVSEMLKHTIGYEKDDLYLSTMDKRDSYIRALLMVVAKKFHLTDQELFDIRRNMAVDIDDYDVKKNLKERCSDYLLSSSNVDHYKGDQVRRYIAMYFDVIVLVFDKRGSVLEYYHNVEEFTEETQVILLQLTPSENRYDLIRSETTLPTFTYEKMDVLFEKLVEWEEVEGQMLSGFYAKQDMAKCMSKITVSRMREICSVYKISLVKPSEKTNKSIKKSKKELFQDLEHYFKKSV